MNQKTTFAIIAAIIIIIGAVYYYGGYIYGTPNPLATPATETPNAQGSYPVSIKNFAFDPATLNVSVGSTVTWTNNDSTAHHIKGGSFESSDLANGQTYSFTFNSVGTFDYICSIHPSMKGMIIVK